MVSALLLFSGGQDSTVCLAWALERYDPVETVGFDYGQRHRVEMECRLRVREEMAALKASWRARLGDDHVLDLPILGDISASSLTGEGGEIKTQASGLPSSFVPGRNLVFLSLAASLAYSRRLDCLVGGMGEADYSGYPDCRALFIEALAPAISRGLDRAMPIETPLMHIDKAGIWEMACELGGAGFLQLVCEHSHSCYLGDRSERHEWGYGCGECPACELRAHGWERWRVGTDLA